MAYPMRIPRSGWSACGLLLFGLSLSLWVYDVSGLFQLTPSYRLTISRKPSADGYVITLLLVTAVTVICMLWCNGCLETSTSQVFAVVAIFTWPFSLLASASEMQCEFLGEERAELVLHEA